MYILSQVLVVLSDIFCIISMLNKKKKNVVFYLTISTIFFAIHYICLGGWTGASIAFVEIVYLILMYLLEIKNKTKLAPYLSIGTILITITLSILTWNGWISLLPMFAMTIYLTAMMFSNVIIVKTGTFIRLTLNGIYMLLLQSYFGAGLTIVLLIYTIVGIVRDYKSKKELDQTNSNNTEIAEKEDK